MKNKNNLEKEMAKRSHRKMEQFLCFECHRTFRTIRLLTMHRLSTV